MRIDVEHKIIYQIFMIQWSPGTSFSRRQIDRQIDRYKTEYLPYSPWDCFTLYILCMIYVNILLSHEKYSLAVYTGNGVINSILEYQMCISYNVNIYTVGVQQYVHLTVYCRCIAICTHNSGLQVYSKMYTYQCTVGVQLYVHFTVYCTLNSVLQLYSNMYT